MTFSIFGPTTNEAIRVGFISTERGLIEGVSVCSANEYAQSNPGTQFVLRDRESVQYLNINEVNKLSPDDLVSKNECDGVRFDNECGPAEVNFYGGGGVGAQGNPIIGEDGAVLGVDLVAGGFGYQYPPIVEVADKCGIGAGAVTRAVLGEIVETEEVYDQEGDLEEYELCEPTDIDFGRRFDSNGKDIGNWDPTLYANLSKDPIRNEIEAYQKFLRELKNPWWTTRSKPPLRITSKNKVGRVKFDVTYKSWNEFMNKYAISPVPPSNVKGSDFAGIPFTFEWEQNFPYDGEYVFRGLCDNKAELYLDNEKIDDLNGFNNAPNIIAQTVTAGVHIIRVDLLNKPIVERIKLPLPPVQPAPPPAPAPAPAPLRTVTKQVPQQVTIKKQMLCHAGGGLGGLPGGGSQTAGGKVLVGQGGNGGPSVTASGASMLNRVSNCPLGGGAGLRNGKFALVEPVQINQFGSGSLFGVNFDGLSTKGRSGQGNVRIGNRSLSTDIRGTVTQATKVSGAYGAGGHGFQVRYFQIGYKGGNQSGGSTIWFPTDGGDGAVRIKYAGKTKDFTKPGTYEFVVPNNVTSIDVVCISGGGSGHGGIYRFSGLGAAYGQQPSEGGGGSGGAYAYTDGVKVVPGSKLKVVVGAGGKAPEVVYSEQQGRVPSGNRGFTEGVVSRTYSSAYTSKNGGDSYIEIEESTITITKEVEVVVNSTPVKTPSTSLKSIKSTVTNTDKSKTIFNTIDYINKADRKLWRTFPSVGRDGDFLQQYGISPFNPSTAEANKDSFAGTHMIRWENINFPTDGNYIIETMVDDNVTLYISNGDDEVIIKKRGFSGPGRSTGKSTETKYFKAGKYRIRAELEQIKGKPFAQGNPMALAINIQATVTEKEVISAKSWNENPMGVSLIIDAPMPPIPQEPVPEQEGRCPNNPIWTTRFPGAKDNWWPVKFTRPAEKGESWSKFMNRYAISPVPPLARPGSDGGTIRSLFAFDDSGGALSALGTTQRFGFGFDYPEAKAQGFSDADIRYYLENDYKGEIGPEMQKRLNDPNWGRLPENPNGIIYQNEWEFEAPYDGFYAFKSTCDNAARILIDDVPVMQGNYIPTELRNSKGGSGIEQRSGISDIDGGKVYNWRENNPKAKKVFITKGIHTIKVELENGITATYETVEKKIFSTKDWLLPPKPVAKLEVTPLVIAQETAVKKQIICHAGGGFGGITGSQQTKVGTVKAGKGVDGDQGGLNGASGDAGFIGGPRSRRGGYAGKQPITELAARLSADTSLPGLSVTLDGSPDRSYYTTGKDAKPGYGVGGLGAASLDPQFKNGGNGAARIKYAGKTQEYTKPGTYEFVVPDGVTSIDIVCIGAGGAASTPPKPKAPAKDSASISGKSGYIPSFSVGGGGAGGAYAYENSLSVVPGSKLKVVVGTGGVSSGNPNGGDSYIEIQESVIQVETKLTSLSPATPTATVSPATPKVSTEIISISKTAPGVVYEGPTPIAAYRPELGFISPVFQDVNARINEEVQGKTWIFRWSNVDFPETGQYSIEGFCDDRLTVKVDGVKVADFDLALGKKKLKFNATKGKRVVELELTNVRIPNTGFWSGNPTGAFISITKMTTKTKSLGKSWIENPMGISAILIPPPCPKLIRGKGVVTEIIVDDPGNGYPTSDPTIVSDPTTQYDVALRLQDIPILPGETINYNCGEDKIFVNDIEVPFECDTFGRITKIIIPPDFPPITRYPTIRAQTDTGIGLPATPPISVTVIRQPPDILPGTGQLIQVTDLVGLQQNGYVNGRPYYGSVFYENGIPYAGLFRTPGTPVRVYATLQESVDAQVTTPPDAIQRSGTDVFSNNPRLNIPGTPENLT